MKNILIVSGDPNSINSEIIIKAFKKLKTSVKKKIFLVSSYDLIKKQFKILKAKQKLVKVSNFKEDIDSKCLKIFDIKLKFDNPFKVNNRNASKFILDSLNFAHNLAISNKNTALINCPVSKTLLKNKGFGITEYLAVKNNIKDNSEVMLIRNDSLAVCPVTTHIDIKRVPKKINISIIIKKINRIDQWFKLKLNKKPKIAVLGLNPHNAELKKNSEEIKIILPSIKRLKNKGINVNGPYASDTIFINKYKKFDVIIGMFHDQVLSPFKAIYKFDAINLTLGLNYLRVSPDHGVAFDIIKKSKASSKSLEKCIEFVEKFKK